MDYNNKKDIFFSRWNWRNFMYEDFLGIYTCYSQDPAIIGAIWQFDRSLSLMLLDYILLGEQLIKATLVQTIAQAHPDLNEDFKNNGIAALGQKYPDFKNVDLGILQKSKRIADEKGLERIPFGTLVTYLSLNATKNLLQQISQPLFLAFMTKLNKGRPEIIYADEFAIMVTGMHNIRNIAAHNGQLLTPNVKNEFLLYANKPLSSFTKMLAKLLSTTGAGKELLEEERMLLLTNEPINTKYGLWT